MVLHRRLVCSRVLQLDFGVRLRATDGGRPSLRSPKPEPRNLITERTNDANSDHVQSSRSNIVVVGTRKPIGRAGECLEVRLVGIPKCDLPTSRATHIMNAMRLPFTVQIATMGTLLLTPHFMPQCRYGVSRVGADRLKNGVESVSGNAVEQCLLRSLAEFSLDSSAVVSLLYLPFLAA